MKNPIQITDHRLQLPADQPGLEALMDNLKTKEVAFERCVAFTRMLQGAVLAELRKVVQRPGSRTDLTSPNNSERLNWADYVKKRFGISDDTARLRIEMWDAGRPRLKKLAEEMQAGLSQIFDRPLSRLSEDEYKALEAVTHKLTDGKSTRMIQEELGLFKLDAAKPTGGKRVSSGDKVKDTPEQIAIDLWAVLIRGMAMELERGSWADLPREGEISQRSLKDLVLDLNQKLTAAGLK